MGKDPLPCLRFTETSVFLPPCGAETYDTESSFFTENVDFRPPCMMGTVPGAVGFIPTPRLAHLSDFKSFLGSWILDLGWVTR